VAMNPYNALDIYSTANIKRYIGKRPKENSPHIFALAETMISNLRLQNQNQSVIVSGESGAGKTESAKYILSYLTVATSTGAQQSWVQQQILEANTVLESFGSFYTHA
jgi:myosin VIIa